MSTENEHEFTANPQPQQADCDLLRDLMPAYSIGATDPDETRFVEATLPRCPEVAAELSAYVQASQVLYSRVPSAEAQRPAGMHARFMARLEAHEAETSAENQPPSQPPVTLPANVRMLPRDGSTKPGSGMSGLRRSKIWRDNRLIVAAGLVAAALLLFTNVYWITRLNTTPPDENNEVQVIASILSSAYQSFALHTPFDPSAGTVATVLWSPATGEAVLLSDKLPPLDADRTYQLWLVPEGDLPQSAGIFRQNEDGSTAYVFEATRPLDGFAAIAVSTEPATGSITPTTDPIALGEI